MAQVTTITLKTSDEINVGELKTFLQKAVKNEYDTKAEILHIKEVK